MRTVYDKQVKDFLYEYEKTLKKKRNNKYVRSTERRKEKVSNFRKFLQSCWKNIDNFNVCDKKKLGQIFDDTDKPLNPYLKQTHYKDESEFQWRISLIQVSKTVVKIYRVLPATSVDENLQIKHSKKYLYESIMRDVAKIVKRRLNEYSDKE